MRGKFFKERKNKFLLIIFLFFIISFFIPLIDAPLEEKFFEDFESNTLNNWTNTALWTTASDQADTGTYSAKCVGANDCDMHMAVPIDTSKVISVNVTFRFRDDDLEVADDGEIYFNDSSGNWDLIEVFTGGTEDTWLTYSNETSESQYLHTGFNIRFVSNLDGGGGQENLWIDNVNISLEPDSTAPEWSNNQSNGTLIETIVNHQVDWTDNIGLSGYIFSFDNGTGTFTNDSFVEMTGLSNTSSVAKVINSTKGSTIQWKVYTNDSTNNLNVTDIFSYNTTGYGTLQVSISAPTDGVDVDQNELFNINSTVSCVGDTGDVCGTVEALARYNLTVNPDTIINVTSGAEPFFVSGGGLGEPWDLSNVVYDNVNISVQGGVTGLFFNSSGTRLYVISGFFGSNEMFQYTCTTAWNLSSCTYDNVNISNQDAGSQGLFFNSSGDKLYEIGNDGDLMYQYTCSTAWDLGSCTYDTVNIANQDTISSKDLFFKDDGTRLYEIGSNARTMYQYTCTTAWDLSTCTFDTGVSISTQDNSPSGLFFNSSGTRLYETGSSGDKVYQYSCSDAWNLSSCTYDNINISTVGDRPSGLFFNSSGDKLYNIDRTSSLIYQYTLGGGTAENPKTSSQTLEVGESETFNWTVNVSTATEISYLVDVAFNSSFGNSLVADNNTDDKQVDLNPSGPPEDTLPQWFDSSTNSTLAGAYIEHRVRWTDDINLSGYIFSFDNGTGTFTNDSFVEMTGTNNWSNVSKVVNSTKGTTIQWQVYTNDSLNQLNATDIFQYADPIRELQVNLTNPSTTSQTSWTRYSSQYINVTLTCETTPSSNSCGKVNGVLRYNLSSSLPDTLVAWETTDEFKILNGSSNNFRNTTNDNFTLSHVGISAGSRFDSGNSPPGQNVMVRNETGALFTINNNNTVISVFYSLDEGITWSSAIPLSIVCSAGNCGDGGLAITSDNILHAVWTVFSANDILYTNSSDGGLTWGTPFTVSTSALFSTITVDSLDNVYVGYLEKDGPDFFFKLRKWNLSSAWGNEITIDGTDAGTFETFEVDNNNVIHAVWSKDSGGSIQDILFYSNSTDQGATWSTREQIAQFTGNFLGEANIGIDSSNILHVVYENKTGATSPSYTYYINRTNDVWSIPYKVGTSSLEYEPSIAIDSRDNIHVLSFRDTSVFNTDVMYHRRDNSTGEWTKDILLLDNSLSRPNIRGSNYPIFNRVYERIDFNLADNYNTGTTEYNNSYYSIRNINVNNQSCGILNDGNTCNLTWLVNVTANENTIWLFDVNFTSNESVNNDTTNAEILIAGASSFSASLIQSLTTNTQTDDLGGFLRNPIESIGLNEIFNKLGDFLRNLIQALSINEIILKSQLFLVNIFQSFSVNVLVERISLLFRSLIQPIVFLFGLIAKTSLIRNPSEGITLSENINVESDIIRDLTQSLSINSIVSRFREVPVNIFQSFNINIIVDRTFDGIRNLFQTITINLTLLAQGPGAIQDLFRQINQALTLQINLDRVYDGIRGITQALTLSSITDRTLELFRTTTQAISINEISERFSNLLRNLNQSININDISSPIINRLVFITQQLNINDSIDRTTELIRNIFQAIGFFLLALFNLFASRDISQGITILDSVDSESDIIRDLTQPLSIGNAIFKFRTLPVDISQSLNINSITIRFFDGVREITQSISISVITDRASNIIRLVIQGVNINDLSERFLLLIRDISASINIDPSINRLFDGIRNLSQTLNINLTLLAQGPSGIEVFRQITQALNINEISDRIFEGIRNIEQSLSIQSITIRFFDGVREITQKLLFGEFEIPTENLVSWWTFDSSDSNSSTTFDIIGNNDGTLNGVTSVTGNIEEAFEFDGTDRITISAPFGSDVTAVTISGWVKFNDFGLSRNQPVFFRLFGKSLYPFSRLDTSGNLLTRWRIDGLTRSASADFTTGRSTGVFYHYLATFDNDTGVNVYIDNVLFASETTTGTDFDGGTKSFVIGRDLDDGETIDGVIDEVLIYNRSLSSSEIQQIFESTSNERQFVVSRTGEFMRDNPLSIVISDIVDELFEGIRDLFQTLNINTASSRLLDGIRDISQSFNINVIVDRTSDIFRVVILAINTADIVDRVREVTRFITDSINVQEITERIASIFRAISQFFNFAFSIFGPPSAEEIVPNLEGSGTVREIVREPVPFEPEEEDRNLTAIILIIILFLAILYSVYRENYVKKGKKFMIISNNQKDWRNFLRKLGARISD